MRWTLPNILTILRLIAAPCVALSLVVFPSPIADWVAISLFVGASLTDFLDGYLARKFNLTSNFGRMLDPIADKVMVVIALCLIISLSYGDLFILIPVVIIMFREIFVSGLREFLGADAERLKVTKLAKWKTTAQMVAITALLVSHLINVELAMNTFAMDPDYVAQIHAGNVPEENGLYNLMVAYKWITDAGFYLLWLAAALTFLTGLDYFRKALPFIREDA